MIVSTTLQQWLVINWSLEVNPKQEKKFRMRNKEATKNPRIKSATSIICIHFVHCIRIFVIWIHYISILCNMCFFLSSVWKWYIREENSRSDNEVNYVTCGTWTCMQIQCWWKSVLVALFSLQKPVEDEGWWRETHYIFVHNFLCRTINMFLFSYIVNYATKSSGVPLAGGTKQTSLIFSWNTR